MAEEEIRQQMILDAESVITGLPKVNALFSELSEKTIAAGAGLELFNTAAARAASILKEMSSQGLSKFAANFGGNLDKLEDRVSKITESTNKLAEAGRRLGGAGSTGSTGGSAGSGSAGGIGGTGGNTVRGKNNWLLSPETFSRVIQTQLFVRGLNSIRDAFSESTEAALKFSKEVSEIRAVDASRSFAQIAENVKDLSNSFNQPLSEVAEAQYQAISNQFVSTADRANILTASNKLAKISAQDLGSAVELVSGSLNAYGEGSEKAELRAAQFFNSIRLGHMRMDDLKTAMGRTQTIGHELGVSMEELQATLVSLTVGGLKGNEAGTQLRGMLTALLKPSQAMREALHGLGVESGEAAVATWNLFGTYQKLKELTRGSPSAMAALLPNVRGFAGGERLINEGEKAYKQAMEEQTKADSETVNKPFRELNATDAEKVTREYNKIKNFFTTEFGPEIVKGLGLASHGTDVFLTGMRTITHDLPQTATALGVVGGAWLLFATRANLAAAAQRQVAASAVMARASVGIDQMLGVAGPAALSGWNPKAIATTMAGDIGGVLKGILGGIVIGQVVKTVGETAGESIASYIGSSLTAHADEMRAALAQHMDYRKQQADAEIRLEEGKNKRILQSLRQGTLEAGKLYIEREAAVKDAMKIEEEVSKRAFDQIMEARRKMTQELVAISKKEYKEAYETIPDKMRNMREDQKENRFQERVQQEDPKQRYQDYWNAWRREGQTAAVQTAFAIDEEQEKVAEKSRKRMENYRKEAMQAAIASGDQNAIEDAKRMDRRESNLMLRAYSQQAANKELTGLKAEAQAAKSVEDNLKLQGQGQKVLDLYKGTMEANGKLVPKTPEQWAKDKKKGEKEEKQFEEMLEKLSGKDYFDKISESKNTWAAAKRDAEQYMVSSDLQQLRVAPEAMSKLHDSLKEELAKMELECPVIAKLEKLTGLSIIQVGIDELFKKSLERMNAISVATVGAKQNAADKKEATGATYDAIGHLRNLAPPESNYAGSPALAWGIVHATGAVQKPNLTAKDIQQIARELSPEIVNAGTAYGSQTKAVAEATNIINGLNQLREAQKRAHVEATADEVAEATAIRETVDAIQDKITAIREGATSIGDLEGALNGSSRTPDAHCTGGMIYRAAGGDAQGQDTIPAMLSPGEMVINAAASQKFFSQLTAINAGMQPAGQGQSGATTNIGDINVTVNGGPTGKQTARAIAVELRRELRRGTVSF